MSGVSVESGRRVFTSFVETLTGSDSGEAFGHFPSGGDGTLEKERSSESSAQNTRNKDPIPLLRTAEDIDLIEDGAKADHLSEFFRSIYTKETRYNYPADVFEVDTIVETVQFTKTIVLKELLGLKESKSPGPEEVPAKMLKELARELAKPLSMLSKQP
ncbi:unnamed protein product [Schistocephalus solidus]|uniref:Uncharacterized protein n=1 Tax=Schistocephalus solidus TaxID=70667 RepID=A0A183STL7_SCHSO|nr:unnamed protein product [Schistocephalus solidus]